MEPALLHSLVPRIAAAARCAGHAIVAGRYTLWAATSNTAAMSLRASV
ncbi:MAG: hypothetical protein IIA68_13210 [Proteobacteria bacterium]|nr:hypothetical protein [Pseudomonadota bacterium]